MTGKELKFEVKFVIKLFLFTSEMSQMKIKTVYLWYLSHEQEKLTKTQFQNLIGYL